VILRQQRTTRSYVAGYQGASTRVARGLYYHVGGLRGNMEESTSLQEVDFGELLITTCSIYFSGTNGTNLRLPYGQVIRFQPYSDGVGVCRNGVQEQIFVLLGAHTPAGVAVARGIDRTRVTLLIGGRSAGLGS
jgi:hypothetical protein